jgi:hypothetical protein
VIVINVNCFAKNATNSLVGQEILTVLAEASSAILYHHGLELLPANKSIEDSTEALAEVCYQQSLPMLEATLGNFSISEECCIYGTGQFSYSFSASKNMKHQACLYKAMVI